MAGRECVHCKARIADGAAHDCWTTTEAALTGDLSEDLREAWDRLRETAVEFGEQRIYASHSSIMFSRSACYCFVRPKRTRLEVCFFLGRTIVAPQVRRTAASSRTKTAHIVHVTHRDEVEPPLTTWLREANETSPALSGPRAAAAGAPRPSQRGTTTRPSRRGTSAGQRVSP